MKSYISLNDFDSYERLIVICQIARNQFINGYIEGAMSIVKENPKLWKRNAKIFGTQILDFLHRYDAELKDIFLKKKDETGHVILDDQGYMVIPGYENVMDVAHNYYMKVHRHLEYYFHAYLRYIDKIKLPEGNTLIYFAVIKDLCDLNAFVVGCELAQCKRIMFPMSTLGNPLRQYSSMAYADGVKDKFCEPCSYGWLFNKVTQFNLAMLNNVNVRDGVLFDWDSDKEISRALNQSGKELQEAFVNYEMIANLYREFEEENQIK